MPITISRRQVRDIRAYENIGVADAFNVDKGSFQYGWQLTDTNVGLRGVGIDPTTFDFGAPISGAALANGQTYFQKRITGQLQLAGKHDILLDQCLGDAGAITDQYTFLEGSENITFRDMDIDLSAADHTNTNIMLRGGAVNNFLAERVSAQDAGTVACWIDGGGDPLKPNMLKECYFRVHVGSGGIHADGITRRGGTQPFFVKRCRVYDHVPFHTTGAVFLQDTFAEFPGGVGGMDIEDTYLEGSGFIIQLDSTPNNGITGLAMRNCRTRPDTTGGGDYYGPATIFGTNCLITEWTNMFEYDGSRLPYADGTVIPHP